MKKLDEDETRIFMHLLCGENGDTSPVVLPNFGPTGLQTLYGSSKNNEAQTIPEFLGSIAALIRKDFIISKSGRIPSDLTDSVSITDMKTVREGRRLLKKEIRSRVFWNQWIKPIFNQLKSQSAVIIFTVTLTTFSTVLLTKCVANKSMVEGVQALKNISTEVSATNAGRRERLGALEKEVESLSASIRAIAERLDKEQAKLPVPKPKKPSTR